MVKIVWQPVLAGRVIASRSWYCIRTAKRIAWSPLIDKTRQNVSFKAECNSWLIDTPSFTRHICTWSSRRHNLWLSFPQSRLCKTCCCVALWSTPPGLFWTPSPRLHDLPSSEYLRWSVYDCFYHWEMRYPLSYLSLLLRIMLYLVSLMGLPIIPTADCRLQFPDSCFCCLLVAAWC